MFGSKRRKAVEYAVNNVRPLIGTIQYNYGIPVGFWQDDFVLGFVGGLVIFHLSFPSNATLAKEKKGQALLECFTSLSNLNGAAIVRRYTSLTFNQTDDFKRGGDAAAVVSFYAIGHLKDENENKDVMEAKEMALKMRLGTDRGSVTAVLVQNLFMSEIVKRFNLQ